MLITSSDPGSRSAGNGSAPIAAVIVLAAGAGTRMQSTKPKVLHELAGKPMLWHALQSAAGLAPEQLVAVLGHGRDQVGDFLSASDDLPPVAHRRPGPAAGHRPCLRLRVGRDREPHRHRAGHLRRRAAAADRHPRLALADEHAASGNAVTVLTALLADPTGYGRIIRGDAGDLIGIVEQKDADADQRDDPRGQLRGLRLRRRRAHRRTRPALRRQRRRRALPDRRRRHRPRRRAPSGFDPGDRCGRDRGHQRPGATRRTGQGAERPPGAQGAARRGDRARPGDHLDPCGRHDRTGHRDPARHPTAGRHDRSAAAARSVRTPR